jgi:peptidoglycan/xylan/chitin deacetylase (PgdA/CDA1 family)
VFWISPTRLPAHIARCCCHVRERAAPLLAAAGIPATAFVSSGFIDTTRVFPHDERKSPHTFQKFRSSDLHELPEMGVDIASHTVNHVDLGSATLEQAAFEVVESRRHLEQITSRTVTLFSFPFGELHNIREDVRQIIMTAGYRAWFSAYGGFVNEKTGPFNIPRFALSSDYSPLAMLMELEGISLENIKLWLKELSPNEVDRHFE